MAAVLTCGDCSTTFRGRGTYRALRKLARREGWRDAIRWTDAGEGGCRKLCVDLCPKCARAEGNRAW